MGEDSWEADGTKEEQDETKDNSTENVEDRRKHSEAETEEKQVTEDDEGKDIKHEDTQYEDTQVQELQYDDQEEVEREQQEDEQEEGTEIEDIIRGDSYKRATGEQNQQLHQDEVQDHEELHHEEHDQDVQLEGQVHDQGEDEVEPEGKERHDEGQYDDEDDDAVHYAEDDQAEQEDDEVRKHDDEENPMLLEEGTEDDEVFHQKNVDENEEVQYSSELELEREGSGDIESFNEDPSLISSEKENEGDSLETANRFSFQGYHPNPLHRSRYLRESVNLEQKHFDYQNEPTQEDPYARFRDSQPVNPLVNSSINVRSSFASNFLNNSKLFESYQPTAETNPVTNQPEETFSPAEDIETKSHTSVPIPDTDGLAEYAHVHDPANQMHTSFEHPKTQEPLIPSQNQAKPSEPPADLNQLYFKIQSLEDQNKYLQMNLQNVHAYCQTAEQRSQELQRELESERSANHHKIGFLLREKQDIENK